jgi:hypothetical protein
MYEEGIRQQLFPSMEFPNTLFVSYIQYENPSLGRFHEQCSLAVRAQSSCEWPTYMQRQFRTDTQFVNLVSHDNYAWCSFCEKNLFILPERSPCFLLKKKP